LGLDKTNAILFHLEVLAAQVARDEIMHNLAMGDPLAQDWQRFLFELKIALEDLLYALAYQELTPNLQLSGLLQNAFNTTYYRFGTFSPTSSVFITQAASAVNPRSYSLGAPIAGTIGVRVTF
jgi:hypothetical protein